MKSHSFNALVVREDADGSFSRAVELRSIDELPPGEVLVKVAYAGLNYKDALSASGNKGVTRRYPHTPGVEAAGVVAESESADFPPGMEVVAGGRDLGMNVPGGFGEYIRVPASWLLPLPAGVSMRDAAIYGAAGFTAAYSLIKIEDHGVSPEDGTVLVTGATGGVGSIAVALLARKGFTVAAATGKESEAPFLEKLGASRIVLRDKLDDRSGRPLGLERWAAVVDTVGGNILATAIKQTKYGGIVTCCGNVAGAELASSVYPFILRAVTLTGIDSARCPVRVRNAVWERMANDLALDCLDEIVDELSLEALSDRIDLMLNGKIKGRTIVKHGHGE